MIPTLPLSSVPEASLDSQSISLSQPSSTGRGVPHNWRWSRDSHYTDLLSCRPWIWDQRWSSTHDTVDNNLRWGWSRGCSRWSRFGFQGCTLRSLVASLSGTADHGSSVLGLCRFGCFLETKEELEKSEQTHRGLKGRRLRSSQRSR